jgi:hypothetical protein
MRKTQTITRTTIKLTHLHLINHIVVEVVVGSFFITQIAAMINLLILSQSAVEDVEVVAVINSIGMAMRKIVRLTKHVSRAANKGIHRLSAGITPMQACSAINASGTDIVQQTACPRNAIEINTHLLHHHLHLTFHHHPPTILSHHHPRRKN